MEERIVGYRGIKAGIPYKFRISVECGILTCVKERVQGNGIPNYPSKRPVEEVKSGSGTGWVGS